MPRDFTYSMYEELLDAGLESGYEYLTMREYFGDGEVPERFVILRHDVDRKPENALDLARIEADRGVASTYYFRTIDKTFEPELIDEIESLGHEIGYHYEDVDRSDGDVEEAHRSFETHLERLRREVTVDTVCMHGNPLTPHDNRTMWADGGDTEEYDLLGEAYLAMDFTDVMYYSDTGRTWSDGPVKVKDHTIGDDEKDVQVDATPELIRLIESGEIDRFCILAHPNRWAGDPSEWMVQTTKDTVINVGKRTLQAVGVR